MSCFHLPGNGQAWMAQGVYITNLSSQYASLTQERVDAITSRFNGVFFMFYQSTQIWGNLASSLVFDNDIIHDPSTSLNISEVCGASNCPWTELKGSNLVEPDTITVQTLLAIYLGFGCVGVILGLSLRGIKVGDYDTINSTTGLITGMFSLWKDWKFAFFIPIIVQIAAEQSFVQAEISKVAYNVPAQ